ncbi:hypothetical protein BV22DRAFT_1135971 [Leucogyrophana mollusca]|uniref:Uncharacterized protein n=1 Tax=Leucogyrophana mollusca TaxID=85980 RepID=A0ACB8AUJ4_9AGAM|nr:hypothetical protein BV22DRAFT_1135971 [Leucogyrophana mollusca]
MTSREESARAAVVGLPENFYSHKWLDTLNAFERKNLRMRESGLNISIPEEAARAAEPYDLSNHTVARGKLDPAL